MSSFRLIAVAAILTLAAACSGSSYSPSTPAPTPAPTPGPTPGASAITIPSGAATLANRAYVPNVVDAAIGDTVTWTNSDTVDHTSTSDLPGWDSGVVGPGRQFSFTFRTAGTFTYHCAIHPGMVGSVVVR
jgi:plastocyanin